MERQERGVELDRAVLRDIDEILRRKGAQEKLIPSAKMKLFKAKLGDEIQRTGGLRQEFVDELPPHFQWCTLESYPVTTAAQRAVLDQVYEWLELEWDEDDPDLPARASETPASTDYQASEREA